MIFQLGGIPFDALQVKGFRDGKSWNRVTHETIEGLPVLQTVGKVPRKPEIKIKLHPSLGPLAGIIAALDALGESGQVVPLQDGTGFIRGWFTLDALEPNYQRTLPDGTLVEAELTIRLHEARRPADDLGPLLGVVAFAAPERIEPTQIDTSGDPNDVPLSEVVRL